MHDHKFTDAASVRSFVLGGNALFTVRSEATGTRFTYKVRASEDKTSQPDYESTAGPAARRPRGGGVFFVSLLSGSNNEEDFSYLGIIPKDDPLSFRLTAKSRAGEQAQSVVAFRWFWKQITAGRLPGSMSVWHEGRCGRCGRTLTVPESIASGFGPECIQHV